MVRVLGREVEHELVRHPRARVGGPGEGEPGVREGRRAPKSRLDVLNAWFDAVAAGNKDLERVAERRFRPAFRAALDAWRATKPDTNPHAPPGPTYMPQYKQPDKARGIALDARAAAAFKAGADAGAMSDKYIRTTVLLATVLFLVGISTHFPLRGVRYGLITLGAVLLVASTVQLLILPGPPS